LTTQPQSGGWLEWLRYSCYLIAQNKPLSFSPFPLSRR
jgi:hypothetical protein